MRTTRLDTKTGRRSGDSSPRGPARRRGVDRRVSILFSVEGDDGDDRGVITLYPRGGGWAAEPDGMCTVETLCSSLAVALRTLGAKATGLTLYTAYRATEREECAAIVAVYAAIARQRQAEARAEKGEHSAYCRGRADGAQAQYLRERNRQDAMIARAKR